MMEDKHPPMTTTDDRDRDLVATIKNATPVKSAARPCVSWRNVISSAIGKSTTGWHENNDSDQR